MKICIISEYFNPDGAGGTPTVLAALAQHLVQRYADLRIDVVTSRNIYRGAATRLPAYEEWEGMRLFRLATPPSNHPSMAQRVAAGLWFSLSALGKLMTLPAYDLHFVVTNPPTAPLVARALKQFRRIPYVYLIHDLYPDVAVALRSLAPDCRMAQLCHTLQQRWLHGADGVVVLGRCMQEYIAACYALPLERLTIIPNWADAERVVPRQKHTRFRARHGLQGMVALYAGNFGLHQDFDTILDAAKLLQHSRPGITFALVGDGARREAILRRITAERIENARVLPPVPAQELSDLLASADALLVTMEPGMEGVGVPSKFYTCLAASRPILAVVPAASEVARVIEESHCGGQIDHGDAGDLAATLMRWARSPGQMERLGANARATLEAQYTLDAAAARFHGLFHAIAGGQQRDELLGRSVYDMANR